MATVDAYADGLQQLTKHLWVTAQKLAQERSLHAQEMVNAYLEAVKANAPEALLAQLETHLDSCCAQGTKKLVIDSMELARHVHKLKTRLGDNGGILKHGRQGLRLRQPSDFTTLQYATVRSDRLLHSLYAKLATDRADNLEKLNQFKNAAAGMGISDVHSMLSDMALNRATFNQRRSHADVAQRAALHQMLHNLGVNVP